MNVQWVVSHWSTLLWKKSVLWNDSLRQRSLNGISFYRHFNIFVDVGRFAYKLIYIHQGHLADTTLADSHIVYIKVVSPTIRIANIKVDSHTQFESIRIQKKSFAYISKFEVILYIARWLTTRYKVAYYAPQLSFWILLALIKNGQATLKKQKQA